ncbi:hypothetical protein QBC47DRAFT_415727 [Echria macrotheca]|uniref:Fungal N-terminal domain-containing protein n=1 Tax=Echria macrotheca TaxID=438768 RepID=A0AAJ0BA58_9PEZI|nr:hypothetical protein QBC47DRAFT_415727 [Echria macrotheca]
MEPISAVASVVGVIGFIGTVTSAASSFMKDFRSARKEIVSLRKELCSLRGVLEILADDFDDPTNSRLPESVLARVVDVTTDCRGALQEIDDCIRDIAGSRLSWARSGKARIESLQQTLVSHKSALSVTLDYVSILLLRDIKDDTSQIVRDTTATREDTTQIQGDLRRVLFEISQLHFHVVRSQANPAERNGEPHNYVLERYLWDLKSDAETVLGDNDSPISPGGTIGNRDWENDSDGANESDAVPRENERHGQRMSPVVDLLIMLSDNRGRRRYPMPLEKCKTWADTSNLIEQLFAHHHYLPGHKRNLADFKYDLIGPNDEIILPSLWEHLVRPGWEVKMKIRNTEPIHFRDAH